MFYQCSYQRVLRAAAPVSAVESDSILPLQPSGGSGFIVLRTTDYTVGSCLVELLTSYDGVTFGVVGSTSITAIYNNLNNYIRLDGPFSAYMRLRFTPAGGFNGTVAALYRGTGPTGS